MATGDKPPVPALKPRAPGAPDGDGDGNGNDNDDADDEVELEVIELGYVLRAHGIRGEIFVACHDPTSTTLERADTIWLDGDRFAVTSCRAMKEGYIVALEGIVDRNRAETLRRRKVEVERDLVELGDDEVLLQDLVGCKVQLTDGTPWGEVVGLELGLQDRLVIHFGKIERLLPYVDAFVVGVDLEAGIITVDLPEGFPESTID